MTTMAGFSIRTAVPRDLTELDALFAASYPVLLKADYPPSVMVTAVPLISRAQPALLRTGTYFVAEDGDGALVGAGGWTRAAPVGAGRATEAGHVRHLVTDYRRVRQGIARAILDEVFATARAAGIRRLDCLSTRTAVPFYQACGFQVLGNVAIDLRPGITFPAIAMRRAI